MTDKKPIRWILLFVKDVGLPVGARNNTEHREFQSFWKMLWFMFMDRVAKAAMDADRIAVVYIRNDSKPASVNDQL